MLASFYSGPADLWIVLPHHYHVGRNKRKRILTPLLSTFEDQFYFIAIMILVPTNSPFDTNVLILVSQFSNYRRGCGVAILLAWTAGSYLRSMIFRLPKNLQSYFIPCISIWTFPSVCHPPPSSHSAIITPRHNGYDHPMSPSISSILILILLNVNEPIQRHDTICTKIALLIGIQLYPML